MALEPAPADGRHPRRHDLIWLAPDAAAGGWHAAPGDHAALRAWIARGRPLVVARRPADPPPGCADWLGAGFTLPGTGPRRRVAALVAPQAVVRRRAPLGVEEALPHAPAHWQPTLRSLLAACREAGLTPRVYGSIVTQAVTGEPCLRPDSDLDVLIDCADRRAVHAALAALRGHADAQPRIDGELRLANGWAVAWRELAAADEHGGEARVLAKSDDAVALIPAARALSGDAPCPPGAHAADGDGLPPHLYRQPVSAPCAAEGDALADDRLSAAEHRLPA